MNYQSKVAAALAFLTTTFALASCAYTFPEPAEPIILHNSHQQNNHLNGIGQIIKGDRRYCTAFLIDSRDADNDANGPAYILTSGHCASIWIGTVADTAYQGQIQFNYFQDTLLDAKRYNIQKVNWASLAGTDIAVMELNSSLQAVMADGINPLKAASKAPDRLIQVRVIGAPSSAPGLRLSSCTQEPADTTLIKYLTVHTGYQKQDCKGIEPGSSGSPVMDIATGEVIGVMSGTTYAITASDLCFWHGLCATPGRQSVLPDQASQSFPIDYLMPCFSDGHFNIDAPACSLKPDFNFRARTNSDVTLYKAPENEYEERPDWDVRFSMNTNFFRFKTVRDAHACYLPERYSNPIDISTGLVDAPIGSEAGLYYLCLVGVDSVDYQLSEGKLRNTQILPARLVKPGGISLPEPAPEIKHGTEELLVEYRQNTGRNIWTQIYVGAVGSTDCAGIESRSYTKIGDSFLIPNRALPLTLCSYTMDRDFNTSAVRTEILQKP